MTDINTGPLTKRAYELCRQVDSLPHASLELTAAVMALSDFIQMCETHEKAASRALVKYKQWEDEWLAKVSALQAFKDYVHKRLDDAGVPTHPDGEHSKAGCRIGDRLDIVFTQLDYFKGQLEEATQCVEAACGLEGYVSGERDHVTDGSPCWCEPEVIKVEGKKRGKRRG